jgi:hypothetical protein
MPHIGTVRARAAAILGVLAVAGGLLLAPGTAHASQLTLLQCQGTETDTYNPGVTNTPHHVTFTIAGTFDSCLDAAGQVSSGSYGPKTAVLFVSCNDLLASFQGSRTFTWNTGDTSTFQAQVTNVVVAGQVITTATGTISQGRFAGATAVQTNVWPQTAFLQCFTTGFAHNTGVTTLTLTA